MVEMLNGKEISGGVQALPDTKVYDPGTGKTVDQKIEEILQKFSYTDENITHDGLDWTVRKYNDGTCEMWAKKTLNGTWYAWGSLYVLRDPKQTTYELPVTLKRKIIDVTSPLRPDSTSGDSSFGIVYSTFIGDDGKYTTIDIARATAGLNNSNYYISKYIKGFWK